jgi:hypothetical protein
VGVRRRPPSGQAMLIPMYALNKSVRAKRPDALA